MTLTCSEPKRTSHALSKRYSHAMLESKVTPPESAPAAGPHPKHRARAGGAWGQEAGTWMPEHYLRAIPWVGERLSRERRL